MRAGNDDRPRGTRCALPGPRPPPVPRVARLRRDSRLLLQRQRGVHSRPLAVVREGRLQDLLRPALLPMVLPQRLLLPGRPLGALELNWKEASIEQPSHGGGPRKGPREEPCLPRGVGGGKPPPTASVSCAWTAKKRLGQLSSAACGIRPHCPSPYGGRRRKTVLECDRKPLSDSQPVLKTEP